MGDTERALQESEDRYRTIFHAAPIGMSIANLDGRLISANEALQQLLGYTEAELLERTFMEMTHPDDLQADLALFEEAMQGRRDRYEMTKRYIRKDGRFVWVRLTVVVLRDADGRPTYDFAMVEDVTEQREYEEQLRRQALYDPLTHLPNRTLLDDRLSQAVVQAQRSGRSAALVLLDIEGFKQVNNAFGHEQGDALLQQLARRLAVTVRASDTVARLHADEFVLVLPWTDANGAILATRKLQRVLDMRFGVGDQSLALDINFGIAIAPEHGEDPDILLRNATIALAAGRRSRSGYALYSPGQESDSMRRLALISDLRDAVDGDGFTLHFQPKIDLRTGKAGHVEALLRWFHPERGLVPPDEFIPLAEETGLINALSKRVLSMARDQYERWRSQDLTLCIAINLSAHNLRDQSVRAEIETTFEHGGLPAGAVEIELTETGFFENYEQALVVLEQFHQLGARIVIDDFGTGHFSLVYLTRLSVDEIKIDRSFVTDMRTNERNRVIVRSTIDLAHNLGLIATAEGVEDAETLSLLAEMDCDMAQGYYISRPLTAEALPEWLASYRPGDRPHSRN